MQYNTIQYNTNPQITDKQIEEIQETMIEKLTYPFDLNSDEAITDETINAGTKKMEEYYNDLIGCLNEILQEKGLNKITKN